jgi:hypothetical protein
MDTCTYCDRKAVDGGYISPAMCKKHLDLAIIISLLKSRGQPATPENIRVLVAYYRPRIGLDPDEIPALLEPMQAVLDGEQISNP